MFATAVGVPGDQSLYVWASAFELILMSLALADRINQEKEAKVRAQDERARAQAALVSGLQQSERELEEKVAQRTAEVRSQAAEIAEWNGKLEARVQDQVGQIDRLGRLKRFFSPQLAEVIVAGGEDALKTHLGERSAWSSSTCEASRHSQITPSPKRSSKCFVPSMGRRDASF